MSPVRPGWAMLRLRHWAPSRRARARRVLRSLGICVAVALALLPAAALWGVRHSPVNDFLGPQRTTYQVTYTGDIDLDLGPLGNAYLPNTFVPEPLRFLGLTATVHGIGGEQANNTDLFSTKTLQAYVQVYQEPTEVMKGPLHKLLHRAILRTLGAEAVLMLTFAAWLLRRHWLSPRIAAVLRPRWVLVAYLVAMLVVGGAVVRPDPPPERIPVTLHTGTLLDGMTVDNPLLATVLNRGISGLQVLAKRQEAAVNTYASTVTDAFIRQLDDVARPAPTERMMLGFSDMHCSKAMTRVLRNVVTLVHPAMIIDSGDDTNNGTASERTCIVDERNATGTLPYVVAPGNHDSLTTQTQERSVGITVLGGKVVTVDKMTFLGNSDPERNPPFSMTRVQVRHESEQQMGEKLLHTARGAGGVNVMLVHQPDAAQPIISAPNPPADLVMWGHMHKQSGPQVVKHDDGSWTVTLQCGTAGGVKQPTLTEFSTPYTPPRTSADLYLFFTDIATGLVTGVQPLHFLPSGQVVIDRRIPTGDLATLPPLTHKRLAAGHPTATPSTGQGD